MSNAKGTRLSHNQECVDAILAAWRGGATYGQIAENYPAYTKSMVAGIVWRNKNPGEKGVRPFRPAGWAPGLQHHSGGHMPTGRSVVHMAKMVTGARFRGCQWIQGQKGVDFKLYAAAPRCPAEIRPGSPYCPAHHLRCHIKTQSEEAS